MTKTQLKLPKNAQKSTYVAPKCPKNHVKLLVYDPNITGKSTKWPKSTSKHKSNAKTQQKRQKTTQNFTLKWPKPTFPFYMALGTALDMAMRNHLETTNTHLKSRGNDHYSPEITQEWQKIT